MTGYQETLTDPSFAGQIITFTFPHIGNVGANNQDIEAATIAARGLVVKQDITEPSNWRSAQRLGDWLRGQGVTGISGVDTRSLTVRIRDGGAPTGVLAFPADGKFDLEALRARAAAWPGLEGMDLAKEVTCRQPIYLGRNRVVVAGGIRAAAGASASRGRCRLRREAEHPALPGVRRLQGHGRAGRPRQATISSATNRTACFSPTAPATRLPLPNMLCPRFAKVLDARTSGLRDLPGPSAPGLALGARTYKLDLRTPRRQPARKDLATGKVEITSQNHGFAVDGNTLPGNVKVTHVSLFDGSNEGIACTDRPVFSVQYHPEASPDPATATTCSAALST